jgi:uncharacterized protein with HEPN domain
MQLRTAKRLYDVLTAAHDIESYVHGRTLTDYLEHKALRASVERELITIGEALNMAHRADLTLAQRIPRIPEWVALRNRIVHGYENINDTVVWNIVIKDLPRLASAVEVVMRDAPPANARDVE